MLRTDPPKLIVGFERNAQAQGRAHLFFQGERSLGAINEGDAYQKFIRFLDNLDHYKYLENIEFSDEGVSPTQQKLWESFKTAARRAIQNLKISLGSSDDSMMGLRNILKNLPNIVSLGASDSMQVEKPFHAVVVSAGPSLDQELPLLKKIQNNVILIAVDAALRSLLENGIEPQIVCCTERGPETFPFFENLPEKYRTVLVAQGTVDPQVFEMYRGSKLVSLKFSSNFLWLKLANRKLYETGSSVAHLCYQLAVTMGAKSIALVGQDLGYHPETLQTHGRVAAYPLWIEGATLENRVKEDLYYVPGNFLEKVPTNPLWQVFADEYAAFIAQSQIPTLNTSMMGRRISGAHPKRLSEWVSENQIQSTEIAFSFAHRNPLEVGERKHCLSLIEESRQKLQELCAKIKAEDADVLYPQLLDYPYFLELLMEVMIVDFVRCETRSFGANADQVRALRVDFMKALQIRVDEVIQNLDDAQYQLSRQN